MALAFVRTRWFVASTIVGAPTARLSRTRQRQSSRWDPGRDRRDPRRHRVPRPDPRGQMKASSEGRRCRLHVEWVHGESITRSCWRRSSGSGLTACARASGRCCWARARERRAAVPGRDGGMRGTRCRARRRRAMALRRTYRFEFSDNGNNRRNGSSSCSAARSNRSTPSRT